MVNSLFDEKSKTLVHRVWKIHKIHDKIPSLISEKVKHEIHPELFDFYQGINEEFEQPEDFNSLLKPIVRRKRSIKRHKNL